MGTEAWALATGMWMDVNDTLPGWAPSLPVRSSALPLPCLLLQIPGAFSHAIIYFAEM